MQRTLSLRLLNERCPVLFRGGPAPARPFGEPAQLLTDELAFLEKPGISRITLEKGEVLPLRFLLLFSPGGRERLLAGKLAPGDWEYAAAVKLAEFLAGERFPDAPEPFADALRAWPERTGIRCAAGMFRWTAEVLAGNSPAREEMTMPSPFHGAQLRCFLGRGSTSVVYGGIFRGKRCAVKAPLPGAEERFRKELGYLQMFSGRRFFPELYACSCEGDLWSMITFCRTGAAACRAASVTGFQEALKELHRRGLRHGDLRRSNLGIREDGEPVLLDFSHVSAPAPGDPAAAGAGEEEQLQQIVRKEVEKHERDLLSLHVSGTGQTVA